MTSRQERNGNATATVLLASMLSVFSAAFASAQDTELRVNVGIAAAKPGDSIDVPLTLSGDPEGQVGSVTARVGIPKRDLTYRDVEVGLAVEIADGAVQVTTYENRADSSQTVVEFSATGESCIRPGILGYLKFVIPHVAPAGDVALKLLDSKATTCEGAALSLTHGDDGRLTLFAPDEEIPVVGCFLFMH